MRISRISTLVATAGTVLAAPSASNDSPVCIVGAGPSGLTAAATLESHGKSAVIFEKQALVGGKCQSYYDESGQYHPLGALLYSNGTYGETLKVVNAMGVGSVEISPARGADMDWDYDYKTGKVKPAMKLDWLKQKVLNLEVERYNSIWEKEFKEYAVVGFKNGIPEKFRVSTADWLGHHLFTVLQVVVIKGMFMYGYGDLREIPVAYILQYFTPDIMNFFSNQHKGYLIDYHEVWEQFARRAISSPIHVNTEIQAIDRTGASPLIRWTDASGSSQTTACSSVILAFPPTIENLNNAGLSVSADEKSLFSKVVVENYYSGAAKVTMPKGYAVTAAQNGIFTPPDAAGEPVLSIRLFDNSDISTFYSWDGKGADERMKSIDEAKEFSKKCLTMFNKDPKDSNAETTPVKEEDVRAFRKWDYFPHVSTGDIGSFYEAFNEIQGAGKTYYASGLNMFEMVEFAIRAGRDVVENHVLKA